MFRHNSLTTGNPFSREQELRPAIRPSRFDQSSGEGDESGRDLRALFLQSRVLELEEELWHSRRASLTQFISLVGKIHEVSRRIFPGPISIEYGSDPEDVTHEYIVFDVEAKGEYKDYRELIFRWHDEVEALLPGTSTEFCLIVHPKK
jgi:hypothetical protein